MCLSINIGQSKQKEFNIHNPSQRASKSFNLCVERFCRSIGAPVDEEVQNLFVVFIYGSGNCIKRLEFALGHLVVPFG
jgi:hypothetical protein